MDGMSLTQELSAILFDYADSIKNNTYLDIMNNLGKLNDNDTQESAEISERRLKELPTEIDQMCRRIYENNRYTRIYASRDHEQDKRKRWLEKSIEKARREMVRLEKILMERNGTNHITIRIGKADVYLYELPVKILKKILEPIPKTYWEGTTKSELLSTIIRYSDQLFHKA